MNGNVAGITWSRGCTWFCSYVEKFTEFTRLFVSIHLHRFENNTQFPVLEFLALLFKYTFKQVRFQRVCMKF